MATKQRQKIAKAVSIAVLVVAALGMLGLNSLFTASNPSSQTTAADSAGNASDTTSVVSGIPCLPKNATTSAAFAFSVRLKITIDGTNVPIPANIGITRNCDYAIHTKDVSGTIYVTPPTLETFTLGQFFALGGVPFAQDRIFTKTTDIANALTMTVNGAPNVDFQNLALAKGQNIAITYGPARAQ